MSRYERTMFFNRLVELRAAYASRSVDDQRSAMTVDEAIAFVEQAMADSVAATTTDQPRDVNA